MPLPPSMYGDFGDPNDPETEYYIRTEYDENLFDSGEQAFDAYQAIVEWAGGSGFSPMDFYENITEVRDVSYNEQTGEIHFTFDFEIDSDNGDYTGTRYV